MEGSSISAKHNETIFLLQQRSNKDTLFTGWAPAVVAATVPRGCSQALCLRRGGVRGHPGAIRSVIGGRGTEGKVGRGLQSYIFSEAAASHTVHDHGNGLMGWPCRDVRVLAHSGRATRLHFASVAAAWLLGVVDSSPSPSLPGQVPSRRLTFPGWRWRLPVVVLSLQRLDRHREGQHRPGGRALRLGAGGQTDRSPCPAFA